MAVNFAKNEIKNTKLNSENTKSKHTKFNQKDTKLDSKNAKFNSKHTKFIPKTPNLKRTKFSLKGENLCFKCCDYRALLKGMQKEKMQVDFILTDPPYNISRENNFKTMGRSGIDFGAWDRDFDQQSWILECAPLLKNGGSFVIFNDWKNLSYLVEALRNGGCEIKDLLIWHKNNPMPRNVNSRYVTDFECAIWAVKGKKKWTFNKPEQPYLRTLSEINAVFKAPLVGGGSLETSHSKAFKRHI